jgi:hypothetical protein
VARRQYWRFRPFFLPRAPKFARPLALQTGMKLRAFLPLAALAGASLFAASPAQASPACTHVDGLISVNVCADPAASSASVRVCQDLIPLACQEFGTR